MPILILLGPSSPYYEVIGNYHFAAYWIEQLATEGMTEGCALSRYCPKEVVTVSGLTTMLKLAFP